MWETKFHNYSKQQIERSVFYAVSFLIYINIFSQLHKYIFIACGVDVEM
jgi:hypothetical protein